MLIPHHQNAGQNHKIKTPNTAIENVAKLKHLGTTLKMKI
jgi:hypothetical protein